MNRRYLEMYIIGAMMQDKTMALTSSDIDNTYFSSDDLKIIFDNIVKLIDENKTVDMPNLAICGCNTESLSNCFKTCHTTTLFDEYIEKLKADVLKYKLGAKMKQAILKLSNTDYDKQVDVVDILNDLNVDVKFGEEKNGLNDAYKMLIEEYKAENEEQMKYGIEKLDYMTQGIYKNELTVIAARPSVGKSALMTQIALNVASQGYHVLFVSLEMAETQIMKRILANISQVNSNKLKRGRNLTAQDMEKITSAYSMHNHLPITFNTKAFTVEEIKANARHKHNKGQLDIVIIDYLQLISSSTTKMNREQEVSYCSRQLRLLSQELNIPVILLAQLNRGVEQRGADKRPVLSDLRESGAIEQDANNVFMLYCDDAMKENNELELIIRKQRDGCLGSMDLYYDRKTSTIN